MEIELAVKKLNLSIKNFEENTRSMSKDNHGEFLKIVNDVLDKLVVSSVENALSPDKVLEHLRSMNSSWMQEVRHGSLDKFEYSTLLNRYLLIMSSLDFSAEEMLQEVVTMRISAIEEAKEKKELRAIGFGNVLSAIYAQELCLREPISRPLRGKI